MKPMDFTEIREQINAVNAAVKATNRRIREIENQQNEKR